MSDRKLIARQTLAESLTRRVSTVTVAKAVVELNVVPATSKLGRELKKLSEGYVSNWMHDDFDRVIPVASQLDSFAALFPTVNLDSVKELDVYVPGYVESYRKVIASALNPLNVDGLTAGAAYKNRYSLTVPELVSKKAFVKRLRYLAFFEEKVARVEDVLQLRHAQMQAKSRLAYKVNPELLDDITLSYIAYVAARANRRSLFMLGGQSKAFDNISQGLKKLIPTTAAWDQVAYVAPVSEVFSKISDEKLGELAVTFNKEMTVAALKLGELWPSLPVRMRDEMVMVQGVDSSRWNAYAGAFNTMRSAWISVMLKSGLGDVLDVYLPGKAPRLMAADIVWWARQSGRELHEDTRLFAMLPKPWDVVNGLHTDNGVTLTKGEIVAAIEELKVEKAYKSGWVGPRTDVELEVAAAEPASVHGVVISDPMLAPALRKMGVFSGKANKSGKTIVGLDREVIVDGDRVTPVVI